jgi:2-keto-3-deoxy-L-rhamnonate aldolase RhmA
LALEALRSAAAELYRASSYCNTYEVLGNTNDAITAIQQALAAQPAPVQEPVATVQCINGVTIGYLDVMQPVGTKLYTTPPAAQRQWVGLTDEEIEQGCKESWVTEQAFQSAVWWAEAKLKEKNNG